MDASLIKLIEVMAKHKFAQTEDVLSDSEPSMYLEETHSVFRFQV